MTIDLTINESNIDSDFQRIAFDLMNRWILKVESKVYRITEIEFYFKSESHNDEYTHRHNLQMEKERWYFHGSGIDITFGANGFYGGILIRAIYDFTSDNYIYGPLNCLTELFSNIDFVYEKNISFGLAKANPTDFEIDKPIAAPRVGLNSEKDKGKYDSLYRFLIMPKKRHAEKSRIAQSMEQQKYSDEQIKAIWG